jgi:hypothetical protein
MAWTTGHVVVCPFKPSSGPQRVPAVLIITPRWTWPTTHLSLPPHTIPPPFAMSATTESLEQCPWLVKPHKFNNSPVKVGLIRWRHTSESDRSYLSVPSHARKNIRRIPVCTSITWRSIKSVYTGEYRRSSACTRSYHTHDQGGGTRPQQRRRISKTTDRVLHSPHRRGNNFTRVSTVRVFRCPRYVPPPTTIPVAAQRHMQTSLYLLAHRHKPLAQANPGATKPLRTRHST